MKESLLFEQILGKSKLSEGAISGADTRFWYNFMYTALQPSHQADILWTTLKDSHILLNYIDQIAEKWVKLHPDVIHPTKYVSNPYPLDAHEIDIRYIEEYDKICVWCPTGEYQGSSTLFGDDIWIPIDFAIKEILFDSKEGEKLLRRIDKDYIKYEKNVNEPLTKKDYMKAILDGILRIAKAEADEKLKKKAEKKAKEDEKRRTKQAKKDAKNGNINDIKSEFDF